MKSKRFFDSFPPPTFLTTPSVGIAIENDVLRVVDFANKHGQTTLKKTDEIKLEAGTLNAGDIAKPDKLAAAFQKIRTDHGVRYARLALPEEKSYVYEIVLPMPEAGETLAEAVEFSLSQNIPLSPAEVVFDFEVIEGPFPVNSVQSVRLIVCAYPSVLAETWADILKQAGITAISLIPESQAVARAVVQDGDMRTVILAHFLKDKTILAIVSQGFVCFATTVSHAIENPEKILASHEGEKIAESVELLAVRDELAKIYSYWMSKQAIKSPKDPKSIKSIIVTGHVSNMSDVSDYLSKNISIPAMLGNVWVNAFSLDKFVPEIEFEQSLPLAAAIGVALQK